VSTPARYTPQDRQAARRGSSFAARYGQDVLLAAGLLLVLAAVAAMFLGHQWLSGGAATIGVVSIITGAVLDRLHGPIRVGLVSGFLMPSPDEQRAVGGSSQPPVPGTSVASSSQGPVRS
jgi:hypothetical protein